MLRTWFLIKSFKKEFPGEMAKINLVLGTAPKKAGAFYHVSIHGINRKEKKNSKYSKDLNLRYL